jgi:hypothetical protein
MLNDGPSSAHAPDPLRAYWACPPRSDYIAAPKLAHPAIPPYEAPDGSAATAAFLAAVEDLW